MTTTGSSDELRFPEGFLWGTATAAHQIEGGNTNNDWWAFEHADGTPVIEPSGDACDSWNRWEQDLDLVAKLGLNSYRFSLEWSRIEPAPGEFSTVALDRYKQMVTTARDRGILPVVTFHHFTTPSWLAERGGWESSEAPDRFGEFTAKAAAHLGDEIGMACTINEPNIVALMGFVLGAFPPGVAMDFGRYDLCCEQLNAGHRRSVEALRAAPGSYPVGLTLSMAELVGHEGGEEELARFQETVEDRFLRNTVGDDFIGVQTYTRFHFTNSGYQVAIDPSARMTPMGYEFYPEAVGATASRAAAVTGLPVIVTENGVSTADDSERIEFVDRALRSVHAAIEDGVDIRGYTLWSLLDNFEWALGYSQHFGIVEVDRTTFARNPKPSGVFYGRVARSGVLGAPPVGS